jgi:hypothetical protein
MRKTSQKVGLPVSFNNNPDIAEGVLHFAEQTDTDLLVISPGLDIMSRPYFIGPFCQRIIGHVKTPILSILRTRLAL